MPPEFPSPRLDKVTITYGPPLFPLY